MNPKVSLIIPVYNVEQYLEKCLDSAINQTLLEIEIIIINDGSTDKSLEICETYAKKDSRVKLITQKNSGLSAARNHGMNVAKGEYIAFLDSDDYLALFTLEESYALAKSTQSDIIIYRYVQVNDDGEILYISGIEDRFSKEELFKRILSARSSTMACDKLFKRNLFEENKIKFPVGVYHEDIPTIYKLFYFAKKVKVLEKQCYFWLKREGSISKSINDKHIKDFKFILQDTKNFLISQNIYEKYKHEYTRRGAHFLLGLKNRISDSGYNKKEKDIMLKKVWKLIKKLDFHTEASLTSLKQIDENLFKKLDKKIKEKSKRKEMIRKIADRLLPKGTKRREALKKILGKQPKKKPIVKKQATKKPMLNVLRDITPEEREKLKPLKDKFKGKRCFIVGNGPSLNKCDLTFLKDEYTFAVNGIFYKTEEMGFKPTFYMVEDGHVVDDNLEKINAYDPPYKFFPALYKEKIVKTDNTYFFAADLGFYRGDHPSFEKPRFSKDFSEVSYCGQSVTYLNMQLAYYLGFTEVYLIGMDFSYQIRETDEVRGATLVSNEDDVNHFHPDYFGKGKKWHDPKVHNVAKNYEFANENFEANNRKIYNATIGGKLEIFERVDYNSLFNNI